MIIIIPLIGTSIGAAAVFFLKKPLVEAVERLMTGFASGVMIAASFWSLILPSLELSADCTLRFLPCAVGFSLGIGFLILLDKLSVKIRQSRDRADADERKAHRIYKMVLAVTIHNIPEGMAVGVAAAAAARGVDGMALSSAMILSLGIAIQNFPEGAIVSMPLRSLHESRSRSFFLGALSGAVEPIAALVTLMLTGAITAALPYLLSFAAGAMFYVVIEELIPASNGRDGSVFATLGFLAGFLLMMALDVELG